jgi:hypothetical protein
MPQYQGVWTLEQQAQAQSNQQWVTDPNFKNTTLLLQADGTGSGSQNQTFLDGSTNNFFITRNGNTTQGSFSPFSQAPGYWGNYFNGSSSYITATSNAAYQFGTGDFTIECWLYTTAFGSSPKIFQYADDGNFSGGGYGLEMTTISTLQFGTSAGVVTLTTSAPSNQWFHFALVRSSGTLTAYINGTSVYSAANSYNFNYAGTYPFSVGSGRNGAGNYTYAYTGYISNFRVVKGTALYTSAFTPQTTPLTAVTNTSLLTCQNNRFVDNSTNAFTITANGTPSVQAFGPFAPALQWTPDVVGGSGYFDGSGDFLNTASNAAFNLNGVSWTIECYLYLGDYTGDARIWSVVSSATTMYAVVVRSGTLYITAVGSTEVSMGSLTKGQWYHVAFVNVSGTITCYINGTSSGSTSSYSFPNTDCSFYVAATPANYANSTTQGYISSLRVLKGTALYTTTFTPPTAPLTAITNTQLLLNYTNAGIYDGKMANNLETVGNAQVATSPVKYGSGSMYFNGSTSYLRTGETSPQTGIFGTGQFTVEGWIYPTSLSQGGTYGFIVATLFPSAGWSINLVDSTGVIRWDTFSETVNSSAGAVAAGVWQHFAVTRDATNYLRIFVNGVLVSTPTAVTTNYSTSGWLGIGYSQNAGGADRYFRGYIDDLRITKGVARYIATFTPPQQALPRQ